MQRAAVDVHALGVTVSQCHSVGAEGLTTSADRYQRDGGHGGSTARLHDKHLLLGRVGPVIVQITIGRPASCRAAGRSRQQSSLKRRSVCSSSEQVHVTCAHGHWREGPVSHRLRICTKSRLLFPGPLPTCSSTAGKISFDQHWARLRWIGEAHDRLSPREVTPEPEVGHGPPL